MTGGGGRVRTHRDLIVYDLAFQLAVRIYDATCSFPREERYSLTSQIRRASRSVCANLAEAWRKRRYEASFVAKLNDAEAEAAEVQVWLDFASKHAYLPPDTTRELSSAYDRVLGMIVKIIVRPEHWLLPNAKRRK